MLKKRHILSLLYTSPVEVFSDIIMLEFTFNSFAVKGEKERQHKFVQSLSTFTKKCHQSDIKSQLHYDSAILI